MLLTPSKNTGFENPFSQYKMGEFPLHAVPLDLLPSNTVIPLKDLAKYKKSMPEAIAFSLPPSANFRKPPNGKLKATTLQSTLVSEGSYPAELLDFSEIKPGSDTKLTPIASFEKREPEHFESPSKLINKIKLRSFCEKEHQKPSKNTRILDSGNCRRDILLSPVKSLHEKRRGVRSSSIEKEQRPNQFFSRQPTINDTLTAPNKCSNPIEQNRIDILCSNFLALKSPTQIFLMMKERSKQRQQQGKGRLLSSASNWISCEECSPTKSYVAKPILNGPSVNLSFPSKIREVTKECLVSSTDYSPDNVFARSRDNDADDEMSQTTVTSTVHTGHIPFEAGPLPAPGKGSKITHINLHKGNNALSKHQIIDNKDLTVMDLKSSASAMDPCEILLNTPKIHIPRKLKSKQAGRATPSMQKTDNALSNSNNKNLQKKICICEWILKVVSNSGFCVEGKREEENGIYWHSNIIVERLANNLVKSLTGNIYKLKGKMDVFTMTQEGFPRLFIKTFSAGFPEDWKIHFDNFLANLNSQRSEEKDDACNKQNFKDSVKSKGKSSTVKLGSTNLTYSINRVNRELKSLETDKEELKTNTNVGLTTRSRSHDAKREEKTSRDANKSKSMNSTYMLKYAEGGGNTTLESSLLETQRTRSGRLIKRPLSYWLGERIFFDVDWGMTVEGPKIYSTAASDAKIVKSQDKYTSHNSAKKSQTQVPGKTSVENKNKNKEKALDSNKISKKKIRSSTQKVTRNLVTDTDESEENIKVSRKNSKEEIEFPNQKHFPQKSLCDTEGETKDNICKNKDPVVLLTPINSKTKLQEKCTEHNLAYLSLCETIKENKNSVSENELDIKNYSVEFERTTQNIKGSLQTSLSLTESSLEDNQSEDEGWAPISIRRKLKVSYEERERNAKNLSQHLTMQSNNNSPISKKIGHFQQTPLKRNLSLSEESDQDSSLNLNIVTRAHLTQVSNENRKHDSLTDMLKTSKDDSQRVIQSLKDKFLSKTEDGEGFQIKNLKSTTPFTKKTLQRTKNTQSVSTSKPAETEKKRHQRTTESLVRLNEDESWTIKETERLKRAVSSLPKHKNSFWFDVAMAVGTHSAEECQQKHMEDQLAKGSKARTTQKKLASSKKEMKGEKSVQITAKVGTLKRKQQMREFLDQLPKENHDDIFSATPYQTKRVKLPALRGSHEDDAFQIEQTVRTTPSSVIFPLANTPQCEHISPGMLGSIDRNNYDKYIYRLQKRGKSKNFKAWGNIKKKSDEIHFTTPKSRTTITLDKRANDAAAVVGNLFSAEEPIPSDEEEDFYFSS